MANADAAQPILTPEQDAYLRERSDWMGAYLVLHAWGMIALAMAFFVAWPNPCLLYTSDAADEMD
jgi:hypothetical protein